MTSLEIKESLLAACKEAVRLRKEHILEAIANIKESLFDESKSTSGDKHHTARAMLQMEREQAGRQLQEVEKVEQLLIRIDTVTASTNVRLGSLVKTDNGTYFISISIGILTIENEEYYAVAPDSPIGKLLLGQKAGSRIQFNNKEIKIITVD